MSLRPLAIICTLFIALSIVGATAQEAQPQDDISIQQNTTNKGFTYQGQLEFNGTPADGSYDFRFILYNAETGGTQIGNIITQDDVSVSKGLFDVILDFGDVFNNTALFLDIAVRPGDSEDEYTPLVPRQPLTAAPFANTVIWPLNASVINSNSVINVSNNGGGGVADFRSNSAFATLFVGSSGDGAAIQLSQSGEGRMISGNHFGPEGTAAIFEVTNEDNPRAAIFARTRGSGSAAQIEVNDSSSRADALFARTTSSDTNSFAGSFVGKVRVNGAFSATSKSFKIDHPLDPANKYLYHTSVESPDMMNIYNGNIELDVNGEAVVTMPDWFEALNQDFRYQLTPIGAPGPNLYVAEEMTGNQFRIAGGTAGMQVSWQVTGIRHDPYAKTHRTPVEQDKPAEERGTYIHPDVYNQSATKGVDRVHQSLEQQ